MIVINDVYDPVQRHNTAAWVIIPNHTGDKIRAWYHIPGTASDQNSYRNELSG